MYRAKVIISVTLFWRNFYIRIEIPKSFEEWEVKKLQNLKERQPKANTKIDGAIKAFCVCQIIGQVVRIRFCLYYGKMGIPEQRQ